MIKPLDDRVVLMIPKEEEVTKSGIFLTAKAREKNADYEVASVGIEAEGIVNVGDKVLIAKYAGTDVKLDGVDYTIVHVTDIIATYHEEDKEE